MNGLLIVPVLLLAAQLCACSGATTRPDANVTDGDADADAGDLDGADGSDGAGDRCLPASISFERERSFTVRQVPDAHLAFPAVTKLSDGRILLVYREGASHVDVSGRIVGQTGSSDARDWSEPEVLIDTPDVDDRDPSVTLLADGTLLVTWFGYARFSVSGSTLILHQIFAARSGDEGQTFGPPVQVSQGPMQVEGAHLESGRWVDAEGRPILVAACSSPVVEKDGALLLPAYAGQTLNLGDLGGSPRSRIALYGSPDSGATWSEEILMSDRAPDTWLMEPALLVLGDGSRLLHVRTAADASPSSAGAMFQSRSADGLQWADWEAFDFVGHAPDLLQLGCVVVSSFRELDFALTNEWVSFSHSLDQGRTWSAPERVADCVRSECGYPSLVEIEGDRLLIVYYGPGGRSIEGVVYRYEVD